MIKTLVGKRVQLSQLNQQSYIYWVNYVPSKVIISGPGSTRFHNIFSPSVVRMIKKNFPHKREFFREVMRSQGITISDLQ